MSRINWHAGFVAAMKLELMEDEEYLEFKEEQYLDGRKQRLDLLIIKNDRSVRLHNEIGANFDKFNILEYKNPNDELNAEHYYRLLGYTSRYLYERHDHDVYPADAYTMTIVRQGIPREMFRQLKADGIDSAEVMTGIFELSGKLPFMTQIIVSERLPSNGRHAWLRGLTNKAGKRDLDSIIENSRGLDSKYKEHAEYVMDVFVRANTGLMNEIKKEGGRMCRAVNELFADEINEMKAVLADKETQLEDSKMELADTKMQLADKDTKLADNAVQIKTLTDRIAQLENELRLAKK